MSVAQSANDIESAGAGIIWVLEQAPDSAPGTAERCVDFMTDSAVGAPTGWCVGDSQTLPDAGEFDNSPFSNGRGFDIIVPTNTMIIEEATDHGTPAGNDNLEGVDILRLVQDVISRTP